MKRWIVTLLGLMVLFAPVAVRADETVAPWHRDLPGGRQTTTITVGDTPLTVDLAISPEEQHLGLGYRNGLDPNTGMLFVFPTEYPQTFWMKGMRFCLDIVWITDGHVVGAAESVCPDPADTPDMSRPRYSSGQPVGYVLEVPAGFLKSHGYGPGTPVDLHAVPGATPAA